MQARRSHYKRRVNPHRGSNACHTLPPPTSDCHDQRMGVWDEMNPEQTAVMIEAIHEAFLIHVMDAWRARQRWAETGSTLTPSDLDDEAKRQLIPRFTDVVLSLIDRGWLQISEPEHGPNPLTGSDLHDALADPASWLLNLDGDHRVLELITTDRWDQGLMSRL
jgi:hypothetical protein